MTVIQPETLTADQVRELLDMKPLGYQEPADDRKHYTHIVRPPENHAIFALLITMGVKDPSAQDIVDFARRNRVAVMTLCGYTFVPELDPDKYDACQLCMDAAGMHMRNEGE